MKHTLIYFIITLLLASCAQTPIPKKFNYSNYSESDLNKYLYLAVIDIIEYQCNYYLTNDAWSTDKNNIDWLINSNVDVSILPTSEHRRKYKIKINSTSTDFILEFYQSHRNVVNSCNFLLVNPIYYKDIHFDKIHNLKQWQKNIGYKKIQSYLKNHKNK